MITIIEPGPRRGFTGDVDGVGGVYAPDSRRARFQAHQAEDTEPASKISNSITGRDHLIDRTAIKRRSPRIDQVASMFG